MVAAESFHGYKTANCRADRRLPYPERLLAHNRMLRQGALVMTGRI